jgi:hypothetical protein
MGNRDLLEYEKIAGKGFSIGVFSNDRLSWHVAV